MGGYLALGEFSSPSSRDTWNTTTNKRIGVFMTVDCYARLDRVLSKAKGLEPMTKKEL